MCLCSWCIFIRFQVSSYAALFAQALPRDAHSTPYYYARPQTLPLNYQERSAQLAQNSALGSSGVSSIGVCTLNGPTPTPQSLLPGQVSFCGWIAFGGTGKMPRAFHQAFCVHCRYPQSLVYTRNMPGTVSDMLYLRILLFLKLHFRQEIFPLLIGDDGKGFWPIPNLLLQMPVSTGPCPKCDRGATPRRCPVPLHCALMFVCR